MKFIAQILEDHQTDEIKWLIIESDENETNGFFLYYHKSLDLPSEYDNWFENIEYAYKMAEQDYRIKKEDWFVETL